MTHTVTIKPTIFAEIFWKCRSFKTPRHPPHFYSALHTRDLGVEALLKFGTTYSYIFRLHQILGHYGEDASKKVG